MDTRWTPVLNGDKYCAPACGSGCTKAAYDLARANALTLATELGEGWEPNVWENMGWHYSAIHSGQMKIVVHRQRDGKYRCFFNAAKQFIGEADTPTEAFMNAVVEAQSFVDTLQFQIKEAQR